jgi:hypothetical protein
MERPFAATALLAVLVSVACSHSPTAQERWFAARGRQSPTWYTCLRMGAALRDACGTDTACATRVTEDFTRSCYAGRYDEETDHATPNDKGRAEELSPCFWDSNFETGGVLENPGTAAAYAERTCRKAVEDRLQRACVAELRFVIENICDIGGAVDLTGAGP